MQVNLTDMTGLYMRLTDALPTSTPHCKGQKLVVANDLAKSFLLQVVKGSAMCTNNTGTETIVRMPDNCATGNKCLTAAQIQLISDWISAGAPQ